MSFTKASMVVTAASLLMAVPALAQGGAKSDSALPTGRSDSDSTGMTKSQMKSEKMTASGMKRPAAEGTSPEGSGPASSK